MDINDHHIKIIKALEDENIRNDKIRDKLLQELNNYKMEIIEIENLINDSTNIYDINTLFNKKLIIEGQIKGISYRLNENKKMKYINDVCPILSIYNSSYSSRNEKLRAKNKYMRYIGKRIYNTELNDNKKCNNCYNPASVLKIIKSGIYQCSICSSLITMMSNNSIHTDLNPAKVKKHNSYKKITYFESILNKLRMQKKPKKFDEIIIDINQYIRSNEISTITPKRIKNILQKIRTEKNKLKYRNCQQFDIYIFNHLKYQLPSIPITEEKMEELLNIAIRIMNVWDNMKKRDKFKGSSFFGHKYIAYKIIELYPKYVDYLKLIPLENSNNNIDKNDRIYQEICRTLGLKYIETYINS